MKDKKPLIILTGPTSVGKTESSIVLAKAINGEIISADSMQVYRHMDIGSAKIKPEEMKGVKHHLIDILDPTDSFDIVQFKIRAKRAIDEILERNHVPIIVGGTGFYIQSVLYDIDFDGNPETCEEKDIDSVDRQYRTELESILASRGEEVLYAMLKEVDPASCEKIHMHNHKRVIRALEFYHETGIPISSHNENEHMKEASYNFVYFVLNMDRSLLYERINMRVDMMLEAGLLDEVKALMDMGCTSDMVSMKGIGFKEIIDYYNGLYTLEDAVNRIKQQTRHFAKKQLTWFRREKDVIMIDKEDYDFDTQRIVDYMLSVCKEKLGI